MADVIILVDNSNLFIEGQKCSARIKGVTKANVTDKDPQDISWRIDFGKLLAVLANDRQVRKAILVGSRPPKNDTVWTAAQAKGFEVITHDRDANNREKAVDTELVAQGTKLICTEPGPLELVVASGDRDFIPVVRIAQDMGYKVEMVAFSSAFSSSGLMATTVDNVRSLDTECMSFGSCEFSWP